MLVDVEHSAETGSPADAVVALFLGERKVFAEGVFADADRAEERKSAIAAKRQITVQIKTVCLKGGFALGPFHV